VSSEYIKLTKLVNNNLRNSSLDAIIFELEENLNESIYNFSYRRLVSIEDNEQFLYEAYYKILDRVIDMPSYEKLYSQIENHKISKEKIIKNLINSEEAKIKKTYVLFNSKELK